MTANELNELIRLFEQLSQPAPSFPTEWEYDAYVQRQRGVLREIINKHWSLPVRSFYETVVDGPSRGDADITVAVRRAIARAPEWLAVLKEEADRLSREVPDVTTGDRSFDVWSEGAHLSGALEWETNVLRHSAKYETDFRGYVREKTPLG
jgi:hypothetical protein